MLRWLLGALGAKVKQKQRKEEQVPSSRKKKKKRRRKAKKNIHHNPMETYQEQNVLTEPDVVKLDHRIGYNFKQLEHRHNEVLKDIKDRSEEVMSSIASLLPSYQTPSHHSPRYHPPPPSYPPPPPSYPAPSHPPPYKAVYDVDFTPIFLSLLPLFLVLGTLLGLLLSGLSLSSTSTSTNTTAPSTIININSTSSSTSTGAAAAANNATNTNTIIPIFINPNGTLAFPFFGLTGLTGLTALLGLTAFPGFVIGRSLEADPGLLNVFLFGLLHLALFLARQRPLAPQEEKLSHLSPEEWLMLPSD